MIGKNNPFNIRYNKRNNWLGQTGQKRGFCEFESMQMGVRAAFVLIRGYIERDIETPRQIITRFAPPKENDTESYIKFVCINDLGDIQLKENFSINTYENLFFLLSRMSQFESGTNLSMFEIMDFCKFSPDNMLNPIKLF